jgi:hypothetical protein
MRAVPYQDSLALTELLVLTYLWGDHDDTGNIIECITHSILGLTLVEKEGQ